MLLKTIPVARRVLGESHELTLRMRLELRAGALRDTSATLDDLREAVTTLEETTDRAARARGAHPIVVEHWGALRDSRAALDRKRGRRPASGPSRYISTIRAAKHGDTHPKNEKNGGTNCRRPRGVGVGGSGGGGFC